MPRKYFKEKIGQPVRDKGWALGEKFGKMILPGVLLWLRLFNQVKKKAERKPTLTVSLLMLMIILNTLFAIHFSDHRNKTNSKLDTKGSSIPVIKAPKTVDMEMLGQQTPDFGRLKSLRDSLQFFKDKKTFTAQDSMTVLELLKTAATLNKNYKHP